LLPLPFPHQTSVDVMEVEERVFMIALLHKKIYLKKIIFDIFIAKCHPSMCYFLLIAVR
jgi:hypothetical protein